jgi:hypothetical protein
MTEATWATSPGGSLGTARRFLEGAGTQTAALAFGGSDYHLLQEQPKNIMDQLGHLIQQVLNTARSHLVGAGTQTAALGFGGV